MDNGLLVNIVAGAAEGYAQGMIAQGAQMREQALRDRQYWERLGIEKVRHYNRMTEVSATHENALARDQAQHGRTMARDKATQKFRNGLLSREYDLREAAAEKQHGLTMARDKVRRTHENGLMVGTPFQDEKGGYYAMTRGGKAIEIGVTGPKKSDLKNRELDLREAALRFDVLTKRHTTKNEIGEKSIDWAKVDEGMRQAGFSDSAPSEDSRTRLPGMSYAEALERAESEANDKARLFSSDETDFGPEGRQAWVSQRVKDLMGGALPNLDGLSKQEAAAVLDKMDDGDRFLLKGQTYEKLPGKKLRLVEKGDVTVKTAPEQATDEQAKAANRSQDPEFTASGGENPHPSDDGLLPTDRAVPTDKMNAAMAQRHENEFESQVQAIEAKLSKGEPVTLGMLDGVPFIGGRKQEAFMIALRRFLVANPGKRSWAERLYGGDTVKEVMAKSY